MSETLDIDRMADADAKGFVKPARSLEATRSMGGGGFGSIRRHERSSLNRKTARVSTACDHLIEVPRFIMIIKVRCPEGGMDEWVMLELQGKVEPAGDNLIGNDGQLMGSIVMKVSR